MNRFALFLIACLVASTAAVAEEAPDWAKRDFAAPASQVYAAALKSIARQHHELKGQTENASITFHVGTTAWSWGYNMELTLTSVDETHTRVVIGISRSGGKTFSWGSGQKEVKKIFDGMDSELAGNKAEGK